MFYRSFLRIPWDIPTSDEEIPRLTHIYRNQHFLVWLAAMDLESKVFSLRKKKEKVQMFRFRFCLTRIFIFFEQSNGRKSLKSLLILNVNEVVVRHSFQIRYPINRRFTMKIFRFQLALFILQQVNRRNEKTTNFLIERVANSAQVLVWRPKSGQPTLVVPPKSIEINTSNCNVELECRSFLFDFSLLFRRTFAIGSILKKIFNVVFSSSSRSNENLIKKFFCMTNKDLFLFENLENNRIKMFNVMKRKERVSS